VSSFAAEDPALAATPKLPICVRMMLTSWGGIGTRRVACADRCLSPRSSWAGVAVPLAQGDRLAGRPPAMRRPVIICQTVGSTLRSRWSAGKAKPSELVGLASGRERQPQRLERRMSRSVVSASALTCRLFSERDGKLPRLKPCRPATGGLACVIGNQRHLTVR
jgi:hypothetical protein